MKKILLNRSAIIAKTLMSVALVWSSFSIAEISANNNAAVILQYHHVSASTPPSTSIAPKQLEAHLTWLKANGFDILPLPQVINTLINKKTFSNDKVVALTFDDANISVCDTAWPMLKKHKIPFTVFIGTEVIERSFVSQCSWSMLKEMSDSGLMTAANHSHRHLNMVSAKLLQDPVKWEAEMRNEIVLAQTLIEKKLGKAYKYFAYPYGEYNSLLANLVTHLGFIGFGQQSGAIGYQSDFSALPRYPASAQHANLETLSTKLLTLPFPATFNPSHDNPIKQKSANNPPKLTIKPNDASLLTTTNCFSGDGKKLAATIKNSEITVAAEEKLSIGRHRYTCTSKTPFAGRFYWNSYQWLVD